MKLSEVRALEQHVKTLEAAKRLETQEIKGMTLQVIFEGGGPTGGGENVQIYIDASDPAFQGIMDVVNGKVATVKADAEVKMAELSAKIANGGGVVSEVPSG